VEKRREGESAWRKRKAVRKLDWIGRREGKKEREKGTHLKPIQVKAV
jgi:hypothetical protein